jgi:ankyrin repeat protein
MEWMTPLHQAVETRNRDLVHLLLDHGADVHVIMNESLYVRRGFTPLEIARANNDEFMIKLLEKYLNK